MSARANAHAGRLASVEGAGEDASRYSRRGRRRYSLDLPVIGGSRWGFTVDGKQNVLQTAEELLNYFNVQQNGIWIVTTSPDAYSDEELKVLEEVKSMCRREKIPLFICRASQLPNGWMRFDR